MSHPSPPLHADHLTVISRFRVALADRDSFMRSADEALEVLVAQSGCLAASLGQATDDPELVALRTEWAGIGAYRRALSSFDVKVRAVPLLSRAIDEPSAFESMRVWDGAEIRRYESGLASDAGDVRLGAAAAPDVGRLSS